MLAACEPAAQTASPPAAAPADPAGLWRATLSLPGGELPFGLDIVRGEGGTLDAFAINGAERLHLSTLQRDDERLDIAMPGFQNRISATWRGDEISGELIMVRFGGELQRIPLQAKRNETHRFFRSPMLDGASAAGRWSVVFKTAKGKESPAVGEFSQQGAHVTGTFLTPTGDHRYLAGEVRGQELFLSTFDGGHAYLYRARFTGPDRLEGGFWSGLASYETFVAARNEQATLGNAAQATQVNKPDRRFTFRFPDLDGTLVSSTDERFRGKVVLVTLAGSWCPNCHDEAAFLAPLHRRLRDRGLEVVSLMFERFGDFERAAEATRTFRSSLAIEYTTLIAGVSDKEDAARRLPDLNGVFAFPTTIFIGRDGRVRAIHTGFSGPATGAHYTALQRDFETRLEALLTEPAR